jgi:hypothetical protein
VQLKLLTQQSKLDNYLLDYITGNVPSTYYSSPEANGTAAKGNALAFDLVPPADIYAFGIICFELLLMTRISKLYDGTKETFRREHRDSVYEPSWKLLKVRHRRSEAAESIKLTRQCVSWMIRDPRRSNQRARNDSRS